MAADFAGGVTAALGTYLKARMPSVRQVLNEWPSGNIALDMPSLSLLTSGTANFIPVQPYLLSVGPVVDHKATSLYVIGEYEVKLQIDLWARNKIERQKVLQEFIDAFYEPVDPPGLHLVLADYYSVLCTYWQEGYRNQDSEASAQRQEWRTTFDVTAMAFAIRTRVDSIIETTGLQFETPATIQGD